MPARALMMRLLMAEIADSPKSQIASCRRLTKMCQRFLSRFRETLRRARRADIDFKQMRRRK